MKRPVFTESNALAKLIYMTLIPFFDRGLYTIFPIDKSIVCKLSFIEQVKFIKML